MSKQLTSTLAKKSPRPGHGLYYDPLYGHIPTSSDLRQVIDLEVFQRLRGIRQLSTLYLVFPGAVHTRFEHSIGVAHLADVVFEQLRAYVDHARDPRVREIRLDEVTLRAMELAGLLHDIGHGPFGHVFEMFCRRNPEYRQWNHEDWGRRLITGQVEGVKLEDPVYQQIPQYLRELRGLLRARHGDVETLDLLSPQNIAALSTGYAPKLASPEATSRYAFLKDLVPAAFGIDRLDYLRRDAFHTGVKTGDVDIGELIGHLHIRFIEGESRLFLFPAAANALESLLRARDAVYRHLYHNPIHRSAQELLIRALLELNSPPEELAFLTDEELLNLFATSRRPFLTEAEERLRLRILYEVHPLGSHLDIHDYERQIEGYWKQANGWREFAGAEEALRDQVGLTGAKRVFFDLERVPAIKPEDLQARIFFDRTSESTKTILELMPHLDKLFGGVAFAGVTRVHEYNDSVSQFFLSFPYDLIAKQIAQIARMKAAEAKDAIDLLYTAAIQPLIVGFYSTILSIPSPESDASPVAHLIDKAGTRFRLYLSELAEAQAMHETARAQP